MTTVAVRAQEDVWVRRFLREVLPRIVEAVQPVRVIVFGSRDKHIDFFCYTPEEFQYIRQVSSVIEDAVQHGWHLSPDMWATPGAEGAPPASAA